MEKLIVNDVKYAYKSKYQTVYALNGISYEFEKGRFYAIVGKSGSGKTTLLSLIAGLDNPTSGEIIAGDKNVAKLDRDKFRLQHVSVIYQSYNLFPLLTTLENVMFPLEYKKIRKSKAKKIALEKLSSVGIEGPMLKRLPSMLSGGEQQRVAIARALATETEFILADEPTGNLDTENTANIISLLRELSSKENVCVIVVTHDTDVAEQADTVVRLSDGLIV